LVIVAHALSGHADPTRYLTRAWNTHKFRSPSVRTVADFDPQRKDGAGNRYGPATGDGTSHQKVFLWGRPAFGAPAARKAHAAVYFMYLDMPVYSATGDLALSKHYFTGLRDGVPQFSAREPDAAALDLSFPGDDPTRETWDIVGQMSVVWLESIAQWVMIYGGDLPARVLPIIVGNDSRVRPDPEGAVHVRFADQPWGPWSAPQQLYKATGDLGAAAPGGILRRPACNAASCAPHEAGYPAEDIGVMYGVSIIEPWTETHAAGVDLYWNVSTWDPYQVVLLKSRFARR
jgi:hypothetical protein